MLVGYITISFLTLCLIVGLLFGVFLNPTSKNDKNSTRTIRNTTSKGKFDQFKKQPTNSENIKKGISRPIYYDPYYNTRKYRYECNVEDAPYINRIGFYETRQNFQVTSKETKIRRIGFYTED